MVIEPQQPIPRHIAIIPDGNRRFAKEKGSSPSQGHEAGAGVFRDITLHAADKGVEYMSLWGLSLSNLKKRQPKEVLAILNIFRREFMSLATSDDIHSRQVRVNVLGRWRESFPLPVRSAIEKAMEATKAYSKHQLTLFLAYNGTDEMVQAVKDIAEDAQRGAGFTVTAATIKNYLLTKDMPPVDLMVRTGGDPHLSAGFMMWDMADAELYFTQTLWPAFSTAEFDKALDFFASRERRFGK